MQAAAAASSKAAAPKAKAAAPKAAAPKAAGKVKAAEAEPTSSSSSSCTFAVSVQRPLLPLFIFVVYERGRVCAASHGIIKCKLLNQLLKQMEVQLLGVEEDELLQKDFRNKLARLTLRFKSHAGTICFEQM